MFSQREEYRRRDLHKEYGGQSQGGISTPKNHPLIFLFTGTSGEQYGYSDGWKDGIFYYTGEGQQDDMKFVRGNNAIRNHIEAGKDLHLFSYMRRGYVRYIDQMICTGYHYQEGPDVTGKTRQTIVFELTPLSSFINKEEPEPESNSVEELNPDKELSMSVLREKAMSYSAREKTPVERKTTQYYRSHLLKLYVQKRANGTCEGCGQPAPFITNEGKPYLEVHHIRRLSDGGPDHPRWVVGVCPNCHRRAHYGNDAVSFNAHLNKVAQKQEQDFYT